MCLRHNTPYCFSLIYGHILLYLIPLFRERCKTAGYITCFGLLLYYFGLLLYQKTACFGLLLYYFGQILEPVRRYFIVLTL